MPPAPPAGGPPPGFACMRRPARIAGAMASLATPAFMVAPMAWQAECMRNDGSFGAWRRFDYLYFTFTFMVSVLWFV